MEPIVLNKPIKITMNTIDSTIRPDYEIIGKLIDNIVILARNDNKSLNEVGREYSIEFVVGKKNKFKAVFMCEKTMYVLQVSHIKELTKLESSRSFAITPKEKILVKEAEDAAKEKAKELEKEEKAKKDKKKKTTTKKTTKKKEKWDDLD